MTESNSSDAGDTAEFVSFEEFRGGLLRGRLHVIVNPDLARAFVAQRVHAIPVAIAIVGAGMAFALSGYAVAGLALVALGIVFRRAIKWQAPNILLRLASRQPRAYYDATTSGVMEVQRR